MAGPIHALSNAKSIPAVPVLNAHLREPEYHLGIMVRFKAEGLRGVGPGGSAVLIKSPDYRAHPLAGTNAVTIEMEHDQATGSFVTCVTDLHGISTFGDTPCDALDKTAEMIRGYIESMEERGMKIPMAKGNLAELRLLVGL